MQSRDKLGGSKCRVIGIGFRCAIELKVKGLQLRKHIHSIITQIQAGKWIKLEDSDLNY